MVIIQNIQKESDMKYKDHARWGEDGRLYSVPTVDRASIVPTGLHGQHLVSSEDTIQGSSRDLCGRVTADVMGHQGFLLLVAPGHQFPSFCFLFTIE